MKTTLRFVALVVLGFGLFTFTPSAFAQSTAGHGDMRDKIIAKVLLGLGGEAEYDQGVSVSDDLETSVGLAGHYEHPFNDYFVLGGYLAFQSWTTDAEDAADIDHSTLMDLSLLPKVRYALNDTVELYAAVPIGLTFNSLNDDIYDDANTGLGWNLSVLFGGQLALTDSIGLMGEMGYSLHAFSHTVTTQVPLAGDVESDFDVSMKQFALSLGMYFAL